MDMQLKPLRPYRLLVFMFAAALLALPSCPTHGAEEQGAAHSPAFSNKALWPDLTGNHRCSC